MKDKKLIINMLLIAIIVIITINITKLFYAIKGDTDYKNLGLQITDNDIEYCTKYGYSRFGKYKVYKIKNYYIDSMNDFRDQLENSKLWSRNKYYEYMMKEFYEIKDGEEVNIDRENLYYYEKGYAIFDLKNAKLYYLENEPFNHHENYNKILGIPTNNYETREIYSVRGGPQNDGVDYYTYKFNEEQGKEIVNTLENSLKWSKKRLDDNDLSSFEYNPEVMSITNGYYHYSKVCRTSDENKKYNFTDEEATGWEVGVYDVDKNILYYFWASI